MLDWFNSLDQLSSDKATLTPWFRVPWRPAPKNLKCTKFIITCRLRIPI